MRKALLTMAMLGATAGQAAAALPPYVFEEARRNAAHVVVLQVERMTPPRADHGVCRVTGTVIAVERGDRFPVGSPITLDVHCARASADLPSGGALWTDLETLRRASHARAYLDQSGRLVRDQFQIVTPERIGRTR